MAKVLKLIPRKAMNGVVAMHDDVQDSLKKSAERIKDRAEGRLAAHRKTGEHKIVYERVKSAKYGHIDHYVSMKGEAAVSVEFGHRSATTRKWVQGLYIITLASL